MSKKRFIEVSVMYDCHDILALSVLDFRVWYIDLEMCLQWKSVSLKLCLHQISR